MPLAFQKLALDILHKLDDARSLNQLGDRDSDSQHLLDSIDECHRHERIEAELSERLCDVDPLGQSENLCNLFMHEIRQDFTALRGRPVENLCAPLSEIVLPCALSSRSNSL